MKQYDSGYLSKSTVNSPITYARSPNKLNVPNDKYDQVSYMDRSVGYPARKDERPTFHSSRRGSQQIKQLRQTFDTRTNTKLQQVLQKSSVYGNNDQPNNRQKQYNFSKTQYTTRFNSPTIQSYSTSAYDKGYRNVDKLQIFGDRNERVQKSPINDRKLDVSSKYSAYIEQVQKLKEHVQITNKMSEQLNKLKQDRRKRMQARQKQKQKDKDKEKEISKQIRALKQQKQKQFIKKKQAEQYATQNNSLKTSFQSKNQISPQSNTTSNFSNQIFEKYQVTNTSNNSRAKNQNVKEIKSPTTYASSTSSSLTSSIKSKTDQIFNGEINGFILGRLLGEGKFGTVYQGFHKQTATLFAIKKVPKQMIKSHLMVDQFCLQIKLQMFLNHQNILSLFHFFEDKTSLYLVLEYMDEGTLFAHLKKNKRLPQSQVAIKIKEIASAVKYLHQNQIAHRDIKPQNIVMSHGVCKLCDFGWATICDQRRKTYCGTFDYAPPEILEGAEYDYTVDLWCLGVLTYELLVGKAPFYHISRKETMKKILNVEKTVIQYPEYLSKNAVSFIQSLIKKDPQERISSDLILDHPFLKKAQTKMDIRKN